MDCLWSMISAYINQHRLLDGYSITKPWFDIQWTLANRHVSSHRNDLRFFVQRHVPVAEDACATWTMGLAIGSYPFLQCCAPAGVTAVRWRHWPDETDKICWLNDFFVASVWSCGLFGSRTSQSLDFCIWAFWFLPEIFIKPFMLRPCSLSHEAFSASDPGIAGKTCLQFFASAALLRLYEVSL